jgi:hypothetical protein
VSVLEVLLTAEIKFGIKFTVQIFSAYSLAADEQEHERCELDVKDGLLSLQYEQEIERLQKNVEHLKMKLEQAEQQRDCEQQGSGLDSPDIDSSEQDSTHDLRDPPTPGQADTNMKNIIARLVTAPPQLPCSVGFEPYLHTSVL